MSTAATGLVSLTGAAPDTYAPHPLHDPGRVYLETNCYTDVLIELLHARGLEPLAGLGCTLRMDFEGDQWTFFKPAPADLELLFGVDIHEMQPYRPLPEQAVLQLSQDRTLIVELDAWYLPDTESTSYRREHVKTSVAIEAIDPAREILRYFHAAGLHELSGEDYRGVFRLAGELPGDVLPPYTEIARFDARAPLGGAELRAAAAALLAEHLSARPRANPFTAFGASLQVDLPRLLEGEDSDYHDYAFATVRMAGSAFEVAASHCGWVLGRAADQARAEMLTIVEGCKALSFRLARRRMFDPAEPIAVLQSAWERAMELLDDALA